MLTLYKHIRESCSSVNQGGPGSFYQQLCCATTTHLYLCVGDGGKSVVVMVTVCVCVCWWVGGLQWQADESEGVNREGS